VVVGEHVVSQNRLCGTQPTVQLPVVDKLTTNCLLQCMLPTTAAQATTSAVAVTATLQPHTAAGLQLLLTRASTSSCTPLTSFMLGVVFSHHFSLVATTAWARASLTVQQQPWPCPCQATAEMLLPHVHERLNNTADTPACTLHDEQQECYASGWHCSGTPARAKGRGMVGQVWSSQCMWPHLASVAAV
jgi:hypothetical protein